MSSNSWQKLPVELKMAVVEALDNPDDVKALAMVSTGTYLACIPALFKNVSLKNYALMTQFLDNVPPEYGRYIRQLEICTENCSVSEVVLAESLIALLAASPRVEELTIRTVGSLHENIIPCFSGLLDLEHLTVANCGDEENTPLSERLVVSIAASIPNLKHLSLDRISRSTLHAPELIGAYPYIPLVCGDGNIPDHPLLGQELSLPSLLRIPSLRKLIIRDTHLGDPRWQTTPIMCQLQVLDLGSCVYESEYANSMCTERIMSAVGPTLSEFSLTTGLSESGFPKNSLSRLRKLHISPFFPIDAVVDTMSTLSGSPIESLSMQCYDDDVEDVCAALEDFLTLRATRGAEFYGKLQRIDVTVATTSLSSGAQTPPAAKRLQAYCRELRLASRFRAELGPLDVSNSENLRSMELFADVKWMPSHIDHGRTRAMTF